MISFGRKTALGLDIGSRFIKIVELHQGMRRAELASIAIAPLPNNAIVDGVIYDRQSIKSAIHDLFKSVRTSIKHVAIALSSNNSVIVRRITVPEMSDHDLEDHIIWEAEQYLPQDILSDVHIDYNKINIMTRPGHMDVMLVAAKRTAVTMYTELLGEVGLIPKVVDIDSFATLNAFNYNYSIKPDRNVILLNVGDVSTNMVIVRDGQPLHTKDFELGGRHFSEAISKHLGISYEEAEAHKLRNTLQNNFPSEFESIIKIVMKDFSLKLKEAVDYFYTYNDDTPISHIYTTGGGTKLPLFNELLEKNNSVKTSSLDVFEKINYDRKVFEKKYLANATPLVSLAVGLALRQLGAK